MYCCRGRGRNISNDTHCRKFCRRGRGKLSRNVPSPSIINVAGRRDGGTRIDTPKQRQLCGRSDGRSFVNMFLDRQLCRRSLTLSHNKYSKSLYLWPRKSHSMSVHRKYQIGKGVCLPCGTAGYIQGFHACKSIQDMCPGGIGHVHLLELVRRKEGANASFVGILGDVMIIFHVNP
jgi:hypothetical protein